MTDTFGEGTQPGEPGARPARAPAPARPSARSAGPSHAPVQPSARTAAPSHAPAAEDHRTDALDTEEHRTGADTPAAGDHETEPAAGDHETGPGAEALGTGAPETETPGAGAPGTEASGTETPGTGTLVTEASGSGTSGTGIPGTVPPGTDPSGDPFLHTRLVPPGRPATFLRRARLVERLDEALSTPLTLVGGPAGAGKTLLVADWAARLDTPVAWLTAEGEDPPAGVFWAYVLQALRAAGTDLPPTVAGPAHAHRVDRAMLVRLAAHLSERDRPAVLVLDEFEHVRSARIAEQLEFVLHHAGPGLRLILVTRSEPLLPLHRYRAAADITEIRGTHLAFTPDEAAVLLEAHGLALPGAGVRAVVERTQGWAAGIRLCALAARHTGDPEGYLKEFEAGRSIVADYLLAEVLDKQPPETQDLLLRASVLDRFRPGLADALTGRDDAGAILAGLHRQNAFVEPLGHDWYRLHPLFAEILRAHLRVRSPGLETELHRRAAHWLSGTGSLTESLAHGAAAGDWDFTARALVDDLALGQLFTGLGSHGLTGLFSRMAPEATSPAAELVRAARDLSGHDLDRALFHLGRAERTLAADAAPNGVDAGDPGTEAARLGCALLRVLAARTTGSPAVAERAARDAETLRRRLPAERLDEHPEFTALLLTGLGATRLWAGDFPAARAALTAAAEGPAAGGSAATAAVPSRQEALALLALIDLLNGWPGRAGKRALAAVAEGERYGLSDTAHTDVGRLVLAAVATERGELDSARAHLDRATGPGEGPLDPVTDAGQVLTGSLLHLARGEPGAALHALRALDTAEGTGPAARAEAASPWAAGRSAAAASAAHLARGRPEIAAEIARGADLGPAGAVAAARALLALGDTAAARRLLDGLPADGGQEGPALTVRATLVRAEAADRAGDTATAARLVTRALREARRERLLRPFLETGAWVRPHLAADPARALARDWLVPPTAPGHRPHGGNPPHGAAEAGGAPVVEHLSAREHDVLARLAQVRSTEEIAADLYVSVNTVKTHLKSVYRKLGVNRRGDAVRRARDLHLL